MREFLTSVASLAGAAMLTALGIIYGKELGAWQEVLYVSAAVLVLCAIGLAVDLIRSRKAGRSVKQPTLQCAFDQKDIGGCVCPNTTVNRTNRIRNIMPQNSSSVFTSITSSTWEILQPQGTVVPTGPHLLGSKPIAAIPNPADHGTYYRIKVTSKNGTATECRGKLVSLKREARLIAEEILLPFAPSENPDALKKTVHQDASEHLDFLFISDTNHAELTPPGFVGPSGVDWQNLFSVPGDYSLDIKILSPAAQTQITILFHWTSDRNTTKIVTMTD